jgi:hypothetical protein
MFQILNPIWLFGISGIIIPLLIHLWNVKKGKTLKIGSVSLLNESSRQNARSLRLLDLLLLLLRCLLIIIVSILLAEPVWISSNTANQEGGWILIEKDNFTETYSHFQKEIDSLNKAGYNLHLFEPGFKAADINKLKDSETINDNIATQLSYWSLLRMLDQEIPAGLRAYIFTPNRLNRFKGERPEIVTKLNWKIYIPKDSNATWIEGAWFTNDSIRAVIAQSEPKGIKKIPVNIDPSNRKAEFAIDIQDGNTSLSFKNASASEQKPVRIDTSTIRIAVYTDHFEKDAEYLKAAIRAIQKYTEKKIELSSVNSGAINGFQNIVFWLSEKKPAESQIRNLRAGSSIFIYEKGKTEEINSLIKLPEHSLQKEEIKLRKRVAIAEPSKNNYTVWEDGFGQPLLDLETVNKLKLYHFYTRFKPEWNGLVWNEDFAKILVPLIIPELHNSVSDSYDSRSITESWILPAKAQIKSGSVLKNAESDLKHVFWISLMLLFLAERWLSFRKNVN